MENAFSEDILFSVIVPVYNAEKYLKECIESVLGQTYSRLELILVNDGSSDSSGLICDSYTQADRRVKVFHQKNQGELASRLVAMEKAEGEYIASLDADDYYDIHLLERVKCIIDQYQCDAVFFGLGQDLRVETSSQHDNIVYNRYSALKMVVDTTNHSLCTKVIKKSAIKEGSKEIPNSLRLKINADYIHTISILKHIDSAIEIKDILYYYRVVSSSASREFSAQDVKDIIYSTDYVIKELSGSGMLDYEMTRCIYTSMLQMMSFRLIALFDQTTLKTTVDSIYRDPIYVRSKEFEKKKYFNFYYFLFLKMFRWKQGWFFRLVRKKRMAMVPSESG